MTDWYSFRQEDDEGQGLTVWGEWINDLDEENRYLDEIGEIRELDEFDDYDELDEYDGHEEYEADEYADYA